MTTFELPRFARMTLTITHRSTILMITILKSTLTFLMIVTVHLSFAQNSNPQKYSLTKCVEVGLKNNINIIRSENALLSSGAQKKQAFGALIPSVDASATWTRSDREQYRIRNNQFFTSRDNFSASLQANLTLFDGFANLATVDQAIMNQRSTEFDLQRTKQDIIFQVQAQYYNVLRFKQLLTVSEENLKRSRKQLERIVEFNRVGSVPLADVYRQQVQVGRDELSLIQADNDVKNSIADLVFLIGVKQQENFDIEEPAVDALVDSIVVKEFHNQLRDYNKVVRQAIGDRADYSSVLEQRLSSQVGVRIARSGYFPSISAFASYGWSDPEASEFFKDIKTKDIFSYGLSLNIPILSNFRTSSAVEQAIISERNAHENVYQLERQIGVQIKKAMNQLEAAEKNIETARRNLFAAREDLRIAEERYAIGAGTLLDQITANTSFIAAQSDNVNSIYNYLTARKQVEYYIGKN